MKDKKGKNILCLLIVMATRRKLKLVSIVRTDRFPCDMLKILSWLRIR